MMFKLDLENTNNFVYDVIKLLANMFNTIVYLIHFYCSCWVFCKYFILVVSFYLGYLFGLV
jgi:hypothetical protein